MVEKKAEKVVRDSGLIVLKRDPEIYQPPYEVSVPVEEVENYKAGGYEPK